MKSKLGAEEMTEFEKQVAQALEHVDAPAGFASRLMAQAEIRSETPRASAKVIAFPKQRNVWMSGAIAAALVVGTFVGVNVHRQHERELATQQFETATRITDQALEHTREQLARAGVRLEE